jgi:hypothetical protein
MEQARLPRLGKVSRQGSHFRQPRGYGRHQCSNLRQRDGRDRAQPALRHAQAGLSREVDDGLVRDRPLDLVAVRRQRGQIPLPGIAQHFVHEPALADAGFSLDEHHVPASGGKPGDQTDELAVLVVASDEGGFGLNCLRERTACRGG